MNIEKFNEAKIPLVRIDKKLNKFNGKVIFQKKLDFANKLLANNQLPQKLESK